MESLQNKAPCSRMSWFGGITETDQWANDSEEEYEEGTNDELPEEIDIAFINYINRIKQIFYDLTIMAQPLETPEAQSLDPLAEFERRLVKVYSFVDSIRNNRMENRKETIQQLTEFPENIRKQNLDKIYELRENLREFIDQWILTQFNNAPSEDIIPYEYYLTQKLVTCPSEFNKGFCKKEEEIE